MDISKNTRLILAAIVIAGVLLNLPDVFSRNPVPVLVTEKGYQVTVWAKDLGQPRVMVETPNGDLIASTYRDDTVLLVKKDADGDGRSDGTKILLSDLNYPFGLVLEKDVLFLAEENRVSKYSFDGQQLTNRKTVLDNLPVGGHTSRTLARGADGWFYLSIGSSCNRCIETQPWRAAIIRLKEGVKPQVFARGLRNTIGFDWHPVSGALYGVNAGSDQLGDDLPPEELNLIEKGKHYGWPYIHGLDTKDKDFWKKRPAQQIFTAPVHSFTAHSTPLSIHFLKSTGNPTALVGRHGSWNRAEKSGYDVIRLTWDADGKITQAPFLTGFIKDGEAIGRPVAVLQTADDSIYISDDEAGVIYKVQKVK